MISRAGASGVARRLALLLVVAVTTACAAARVPARATDVVDGAASHSRRMDLALYEHDALEVVFVRVFDSDQLTSADSARASLAAAASATLSRHRPVVVDFRWRR